MLLDAAKPGDAVDVDEEARLQKAHVERRHQALAAGQQLRLIAMLGEKIERLLERRGAAIGKVRRLQSILPLFFLFAQLSM